MERTNKSNQTLQSQLMESWTSSDGNRRDDLIEQLTRKDTEFLINAISLFLERELLSEREFNALSEKNMKDYLKSLHEDVQCRLTSPAENSRAVIVNSSLTHIEEQENNGIHTPNTAHWVRDKKIGLESDTVSQVDVRNTLNRQGWVALNSFIPANSSVAHNLAMVILENRMDVLRHNGMSEEAIKKEISDHYIYTHQSRSHHYTSLSPAAQNDIANIIRSLESLYQFSFENCITGNKERGLKRAGYATQSDIKAKHLSAFQKKPLEEIIEELRYKNPDDGYIYRIPSIRIDEEKTPYIKWRHLLSPKAVEDINESISPFEHKSKNSQKPINRR